MSVTIEIKQCVDCPHHQIAPDPDPNDWFNDDDVKVVCLKARPIRSVAIACRPYNVRKETTVPDWCPLKARSVGA